MPDPTTAAWIAAACGSVASLVLVALTISTWRQWARTRDTRAAASALVDTHRARLDATIDQVADQAATIAVDSQELRDAIAQLRADVDHLTWLANRVPDARDDLRTALLDLVLPTKRQPPEETS